MGLPQSGLKLLRKITYQAIFSEPIGELVINKYKINLLVFEIKKIGYLAIDTLAQYRAIIQQELKEYTEIPYAHGDLQCRLIISEDRNNFLLITQGWEDDVQVHGCLVHIEAIWDLFICVV